MTAIGGLLSAVVLFGERAPDVAHWAFLLTGLMPLAVFACGVYLLITGLRMP